MRRRLTINFESSHPIDCRILDALSEDKYERADQLKAYMRAGFALLQHGMSSPISAILACGEEEIATTLALVLANPTIRTRRLKNEIRRQFFEDEHGEVRPIKSVRQSDVPISTHEYPPTPIPQRTKRITAAIGQQALEEVPKAAADQAPVKESHVIEHEEDDDMLDPLARLLAAG